MINPVEKLKPAVDPRRIEDFHTEGFARFDEAVSDGELSKIAEIYDELFTEVENRSGFINLGGKSANGELLMPQISSPERHCPELHELDCFAYQCELARAMFGPEVRYSNSHMILKPANSPRNTPWHQDQAYHNPNYHYTKVNFWMPLEDATAENGCLHFVPRSHKGLIVPHESCSNSGGATALAAKDQDYWLLNGHCLPCPRGSISAHHSYCLHYANGNSSPRARRAWINVFTLPKAKLARFPVLPWQNRP